jgi:periplasmic protein CpxP/Spy
MWRSATEQPVADRKRTEMKLHRLNIVAALAICGLLAIASTGSAQSTNTNSNNRQERRGPNVKQRIERLSNELKLNDDQKAKVTALFEKEAKEGRELREDKNLSRDERREKGRAMRQTVDKEMKTILTPEQLEKYKQLREQMRERRQGGAGRSGDAAPAPKPEPKNPEKAQ